MIISNVAKIHLLERDSRIKYYNREYVIFVYKLLITISFYGVTTSQCYFITRLKIQPSSLPITEFFVWCIYYTKIM